MAKNKTIFGCKECGNEYSKWQGRCEGCGSWNTIIEIDMSEKHSSEGRYNTTLDSKIENVPLPITTCFSQKEERLKTNIGEMDRILGGGIVPGTLLLIGGEPGVGKSTLLLQVSASLAAAGHGKILYISGEESAAQARMRAERLLALNDNLYVFTETNLDLIIKYIKKIEPVFVVIDSVQTIYKSGIESAPGTLSQIRESTGHLLFLSKQMGVAIALIGHVTKSGVVAGPRMLEHMVDTVLYFEGERSNQYRILRAVKNRFGSTNEIGIFEMTNTGLMEVENPSNIFLNERPKDSSGTVVVPTLEGSRPLLVEVQALTSSNGGFGAPRRSASGIDQRRLSLLCAVIEKRIALVLNNQDIYVNVAGGLKIVEPAVDLGIVCAIVSSFRNRPIDHELIVIGEVGLSGEIRSVNNIEKRINEAIRLGFKKIILPNQKIAKNLKKSGIEFYETDSIKKTLEYLDLIF